MSRQGVDLDRSTLADLVWRAAYEMRPVFDALIVDLKRSAKPFMDRDPCSGSRTGLTQKQDRILLGTRQRCKPSEWPRSAKRRFNIRARSGRFLC